MLSKKRFRRFLIVRFLSHNRRLVCYQGDVLATLIFSDFESYSYIQLIFQQMDALDSNEELTELGRHLADLPVEPHLGKMVLNSIVLKCIDPVLTIVCSLAYKDPCTSLLIYTLEPTIFAQSS